MATGGEVTDESETPKCPVCVTKFINPRTLPCLHTICEKCLLTDITSQQQYSTEFTCPICKTATVPSEADLSVDKWMDEFIPDSTMKFQVGKIESLDNKDVQCDPCKRDGENTTAEIWCLECQEKLCGPCVKYHKRYNVSIKHTMVSVSNNIQKLNSRSRLRTPMCAAQVEKCDFMTSSVTLRKTVTRQDLGNGTDITGGAFLRDGRLVMADYNNNRLLQLDDDYNIVREHKMDGHPKDVAAGNNQNEMYISLYNYPDFYIYQCTLDTHLETKQSITAPLFTWGIAISGDKIIAGAGTSVSILSRDGSTVNSMSKPHGYYCYVAVSHTTPTLYHRDEDSVVCRTFNGKEFFRYN